MARCLLRALVSERQARGSVFAPMHWNDQFASRARIDVRCCPGYGPAFRPARFEKRGGEGKALRGEGLWFRHLPHPAGCAGLRLLGHRPKPDGGYRMELAFAEEPQDWTLWARQVFGIDARIEPLGYSDRQTGDLRLAFFDGETLLAALFIAR